MAPSPKPSLSTPAFPRNASTQPSPSNSTSTSLRPPRPRTMADRERRLQHSPLAADDDEHLTPASLERLRSLERDYRSSRLLNELDPSAMPPSPSATTRKGRRGNDTEFATEIAQGLLLEVRKMQAALHQKEQQVNQLISQKADLERDNELMVSQLRQREEVQDRLKEQTWDLELAKQDLSVNITDLQQNLNRSHVEQSRLTHQLNELQAEMDKMRDREEKQGATMETMKTRHEHDMGIVRRHAAGLQREKLEMRKQIDALTSELAIARAQTRIVSRDKKRSSIPPPPTTTSTVEPNDTLANETAQDSSKNGSNDDKLGSPKSTTRNQQLEVETLKSSLAHAHRMVSNLRSNLHKEKTEKFEFKKLLAESQETIEQLQSEMWVDQQPSAPQSGSNNRRGGKRGRKAARRGGTSVRMPSTTRSGDVSEQEDESILLSSEESGQSGDEDNKQPIPQPSLSTQLSLADQLNAAMSSAPSPQPSQSLADQLNAAMSVAPSQSLADEKQRRPEPVTTSTQTDLRVWNDQQLNVHSVEPAAVPTFVDAGINVTTSSMDTKATPILAQKDQPVQYSIPKMRDHELDTFTTEATWSESSITHVEPVEIVANDTIQVASDNNQRSLPSDQVQEQKESTPANVTQHELDNMSSSPMVVHGVKRSVGTEPCDTIQEHNDPMTQTKNIEYTTVHNATDAVSIEPEAKEPAVLTRNIDSQTDKIELHDASSQVFDAPPTIPELSDNTNIHLHDIAPRIVTDVVDTREMMTHDAPSTIPELSDSTNIHLHDIAPRIVTDVVDTREMMTHDAPSTIPELSDSTNIHLQDIAPKIVSDAVDTPEIKIHDASSTIPELSDNTNIHLHNIAPQITNDVVDTPEMTMHTLPPISLDPVTKKNHDAATSPVQSIVFSEHRVPSHNFSTVDTNDKREPVVFNNAQQTSTWTPATENISSIHQQSTLSDNTFIHDHVKPSTTENRQEIAQLTSSFTVESTHAFSTEQVDNFTNNLNVETPLPVTEKNNSSLQQQQQQTALSTVSTCSINVTPASSSANVDMHDKATATVSQKDFNIHTVSPINVEPSGMAESTTLTQEQSQNVSSVQPSPVPAFQTTRAADIIAPSTQSQPFYTHSSITTTTTTTAEMHTQKEIPTLEHNDCNKMSLTSTPLQSTNVVPTHHESVTKDTHPENLNTQVMPSMQQLPVASTPSIMVSSASSDFTVTQQSSMQAKEVAELSVGAQASQNVSSSPMTTVPREQPGPIPTPPQPNGDGEYGHVSVTQHSNGEKLLTQSEADAMVEAALAAYKRQSIMSGVTPNEQPMENDYGVAYINTQTMTYKHRRESASSTASTMASATSTSSHMMDTSHLASMGNMAAPSSAITLITRTMIGDWMWKYTRKTMGGGLSERRHLRFFWIHPYTRTLYWSVDEPGADGRESRAKSAFIENVCTIVTPHPQGLPNVSLLIQTTGRPLKVTAPDTACHDVWYEALMHLLSRAETGDKSLGHQDIAASLSTSSLVSKKASSIHRLRPMRSISSSITGASSKSTATLASNKKSHR